MNKYERLKAKNPLFEKLVEKFDLLPTENIIFVDGSCIGNPGPGEYRGVINDQVVFNQKFSFQTTNNIMEFVAIVHGLGYAQKQGFKDFIVFSDSQTAIAWVKRLKCNSGLENIDPEQKDIIQRAEKYLNANSHIIEKVEKWDTRKNGEIPADFGRKNK